MIDEELSELLEALPDKLQTIKSEVEITPEEQQSYISYHNKINLDKYPEKQVSKESSNLFDKNFPLEGKKRILFCLAHFGSLESFKMLDKYLENPDKELMTWAVLCIEECRRFLEMELMGEDQMLVFGGAGGDGKRGRFYFIVTAENTITEDRQTFIQNTFEQTAKDHDSIIEYIEFKNNYGLISCLLSIEVAPDTLAMDGITDCNKGNDLLRVHYYVSNMKKPDEGVIEEYLKDFNN